MYCEAPYAAHRLGMKLIGDGLTGSWERRGSDSALLRRRRCEYARRSKFKSEDHGRRRATVHLENSQIAGETMVSDAGVHSACRPHPQTTSYANVFRHALGSCR